MSEIHRIFYHEVGHFVAHELNHIVFNDHCASSITLTPHPQLPGKFDGVTKVGSLSTSFIPSLEELPRYLANCTYGCLFQASYLEGSFKCIAGN